MYFRVNIAQKIENILVFYASLGLEFCIVFLKIAIMNEIVYYPTMFHTNPFSFTGLELWERTANEGRKLTLVNKRAKELGISKMKLNVSKFSVLDDQGQEHVQTGFPNKVEFNSKGIDTEFYVRNQTNLVLEPGHYTTFRFYLGKTDNLFVYNDRSRDTNRHMKYLDFEIRNGFISEEKREHRVLMQFDFEPFSLKSYFRSLKNVFRESKSYKAQFVNG